MDLDRALECALDGEAILFIGAGFSRGATNVRRTDFRTGTLFAAHLTTLAGLPPDTPLEDASEEFAQKQGDDRLMEELRQEFSAQKVTPAQISIAQIPWKRIYTTNYDNVMEKAYSQSSRAITPVTIHDDISKTVKTDTIIVHLNGYIERLHKDNLWTEIKLTEASYLTASILESEWAILFRQDLSIAKAVFFIGYSAYDLDIRRLIYENPELKEKCFFVLGTIPDPATKRRVSRFGSVLPLGTNEFVVILENKLKKYTPPAIKPFLGYCIQKFDDPKTTKRFSDQSVFDLFMLGDCDTGFVWNSMHAGPTYSCERNGTGWYA